MRKNYSNLETKGKHSTEVPNWVVLKQETKQNRNETTKQSSKPHPQNVLVCDNCFLLNLAPNSLYGAMTWSNCNALLPGTFNNIMFARVENILK